MEAPVLSVVRRCGSWCAISLLLPSLGARAAWIDKAEIIGDPCVSDCGPLGAVMDVARLRGVHDGRGSPFEQSIFGKSTRTQFSAEVDRLALDTPTDLLPLRDVLHVPPPNLGDLPDKIEMRALRAAEERAERNLEKQVHLANEVHRANAAGAESATDIGTPKLSPPLDSNIRWIKPEIVSAQDFATAAASTVHQPAHVEPPGDGVAVEMRAHRQRAEEDVSDDDGLIPMNSPPLGSAYDVEPTSAPAIHAWASPAGDWHDFATSRPVSTSNIPASRTIADLEATSTTTALATSATPATTDLDRSVDAGADPRPSASTTIATTTSAEETGRKWWQRATTSSAAMSLPHLAHKQHDRHDLKLRSYFSM